jgi:hypothetical protein
MKIQNLFKSIIVSVVIITPSAFAAGKITGINFSGPDDPSHTNVIQMQIEGGFSSGSCDATFAAIRNTEDRKHLISFALTAFASKEPVTVVLNGSDKYFAERCTISRISSVY